MTSSTGSITSMGIGSGLDVNSIISKLMSVESQPMTILQQQQQSYNTELSGIGQLASYTSAMTDAAQKIASVALWKQTTASSSDTSSVNVSTDSTSAPGTYAVSVQQLATSQTVSSRAFGDSTATFGAGSLTIELGSWTGEPAPTGFTPKSGSSAITVQVAEGDSLATIRDKINAAGAGVNATIVTDASGARLALRSSDTGAENAFRVTTSETNDDGDATAGLSAFAFDATQASQMTRNQTAVNAQATINGIAVSSASNTLTGVSDGLTITLQKQTTSDVSLTVANDSTGQQNAINAFVTAFNQLTSYIHNQTKYDPDSKTGGPMQGDQTVLGLQSQLRNVINQESSASGTYQTLSQIGISMQTDGTLAVDSSKLSAALDNPTELRKLLAADGDTTAEQGFMTRFVTVGNAATDATNGSLTVRTNSLNDMIKRNQQSQDAMQQRLDDEQASLEKQYQALDTTMAQMSQLSSYLTTQLSSLSATA